MVKTAKGNRKIEDIVAGDFVFAYDFTSEKTVLAKVEETFTNWTTELVKIETLNQSIKSTKNHYFWVDEHSDWLRADNLIEKMKLSLVNQEQAVINNISLTSEEVLTFNFKVENYHNYFVGEIGILVHNDDGGSESVSKFAETQVFSSSTVYVLRDPVTKQVIYVGQTIDEPTRFTSHLTNPDSAVYQYLLNNDPTFRQLVNTNPDILRNYDMSQFLRIVRPIHNRSLTTYELTVWEQHYIDLYGKAQSQGGTLENRIRAITPEVVEFYRLLHNPCG